MNRHIPKLEERMRKHVPMEVEYASFFWTEHLSGCSVTDRGRLREKVKQFLYAVKILNWMEVLSLLNATRTTSSGKIWIGTQILLNLRLSRLWTISFACMHQQATMRIPC